MIKYDPHQWRNLFTVRGTVVKQILKRVSYVTVWSMGVAAVHELWWPVELSDKIHALLSVALGLLLVVRTNASYDRFWEGRKLWGGIVNESRNLARKAVVMLASSPRDVKRVVRWTMVLPAATMNRLRGTRGLGPAAERLPTDEVQEALAAQHVPTYVSVRITEAIADCQRRGLLTDVQQQMLDADVQQLIDCVGACERIHNTPLPFAYVIHLRRALAVYLSTLPFAMVGTFGWYTPLAMLAVSYIMLGIEEIGVQIEDPFGEDDNDLPLEQICASIEATLGAMLPGGDPESSLRDPGDDLGAASS